MNSTTSIEYALRIDTRAREIEGPGAAYVSNLDLLNNRALFHRLSRSGFTDFRTRASGIASSIYRIRRNATHFVAVGSSGRILTSPDGVNWTARTSGVTGDIRDVLWDGSRWLALTANGVILTSATGETWITLASISGPHFMCGIAYSGSLYMAVGGPNKCYTSPDAVTWTARDAGITGQFFSVTHGNGIFVAVAWPGQIRTTTDGTSFSSPSSGTGADLNDVIWTGERFVAVGNNGVVLTSASGSTWTLQTTGITSHLQCVTLANGRLYAAGGSGKVLTSKPDGVSWTEKTAVAGGSLVYFGVAASDYTIAIGGSAGSFASSPLYFDVAAYATDEDRAAGTDALGRAVFAYASLPAAVGIPNQAAYDLAPFVPGDLPLDFDVTPGAHDESIGLYDSSFCLITGRPGFRPYGNEPQNPPENPITLEPQLTWKEGLIAAWSLGNPGQYVDPTLGGGYSTMSGAELRLINNPPGLDGATLFDYLRDHGIDLFRCELRFYVVLDEAFHLWGTYEIEEVANEEHHVKLLCVDKSLTIHKNILKTEISTAGFPAAPQESLGKFLPLCIGRVPQAELVPVTGQIVLQKLSKSGTVEYELARIDHVDNNSRFRIKTGSQTFKANDLKDKYVRVVRGGQGGVALISANDASGGTGENLTVVIHLPSSFPETLGAGMWVEIYDLQNFSVASDGPIHGFTKPLLGYRDDRFIDIEGKVIARYPPLQGAPQDSGYGDVSGVRARPEGDFAARQPQDGWLVHPAALKIGNPVMSTQSTYPNPIDSKWNLLAEEFPVIRMGSNRKNAVTVSNDYPPIGEEPTDLVDGKRATQYERSVKIPKENLKGASAPGSNASTNFLYYPKNQFFDGVLLDFQFPEGFMLASDETLSLAVDGIFKLNIEDIAVSVGSTHLSVAIQYYLYDIYEQKTSLEGVVSLGERPLNLPFIIDQVKQLYYDGVGEGAQPRELPPVSASAGQPEQFYSLLRNAGTAATVKGLRIKILTISWTSSVVHSLGANPFWGMTSELHQIALFRKRDAYVGPKYHYVTGVRFGGDWGEERDPPRTAGQPVLSIPDAVEYILRERDRAGDLVDTGSFDATLKQRSVKSFHVGRQVREQKNSQEYIAELCRQGFLALVPGRDGRRRLLPLDGYENPGVSATYDAGNVLDGSVEDSPVAGLDRVHTGLELRYDRNPANGEYRSTVYVRHTDRPAFPAENLLLPGSKIPVWTEYAGGFRNYGTAESVWMKYREAFLLSQRENIYKLDCDWFQSNETLGLGTEDEDPAAYLAEILSAWYAVPRVPYAFRVPLTAENLQRRLLDRVVFADVRRTGGLYYQTLVEGMELDTARAQIRMNLSRRATDVGDPIPEAVIEPPYLVEIADGDTITEIIGGDMLTEVVHP